MKALYISADHVYFLENKLLALVDQLFKKTDIRFLCIDEIHKYPNWQQELKNIADFYLDFKIIFSGSSMIDILHSKFDLSRRVTLYRLHGLSFREYVAFTQQIEIPSISLSDLLKKHESLARLVSEQNIEKEAVANSKAEIIVMKKELVKTDAELKKLKKQLDIRSSTLDQAHKSLERRTLELSLYEKDLHLKELRIANKERQYAT